MSRLSLLVVTALTLWGSTARAGGGAFGLGLVLGEPTGVTGLYKLGGNTAIDGAIGLDDFGFDGVYLHADFLFVLPDLLSSQTAGLRPYLGPGAFAIIGDDGDNSGKGNGGDSGGGFGLGARVPFGLSLEFRRVPLQLFLEVAPQLQFVPEFDFGLGGALGFRYFF